MSEDFFRPKKAINSESNEEAMENKKTLDTIQGIKQMTKQEEDSGIQVSGNVPPEFQKALKQKQSQSQPPQSSRNKPKKPNFQEARLSSTPTNPDLDFLIQKLSTEGSIHTEVELPSKGKFYDGINGPIDGILNIRRMTGEEEMVLASQKNKALNIIFKKCLLEKNFNPENLLYVDRIYLLIKLRIISYTPEYEVEITCPECDRKFSHIINLAELEVEYCPDNFTDEILQNTLPTSGFNFRYRFPTGKDEVDIQDYRDRKIKMWGNNQLDDTILYRSSLLLEEIENIVEKSELLFLLKKLPVNDVSYIRTLISEPPFGVQTKIDIGCPGCMHEIVVDLPFDGSFFSPKHKKTE